MKLHQKLISKYKEKKQSLSERLYKKRNDNIKSFDDEFTERIKYRLKLIDETELTKVVNVGFYTVFMFNSSYGFTYLNKLNTLLPIYIRLNRCLEGEQLLLMTEDVDRYDITNKTINPKYMYEKIKEYIKPINDIEPEFDDANLIIKYSWISLPDKKKLTIV